MGQGRNQNKNIRKSELNAIIPSLHEGATLVILDDSCMKDADENECKRMIRQIFSAVNDSGRLWGRCIVLSSCKRFIHALIEEEKEERGEKFRFHNPFLIQEPIPNSQSVRQRIDVYVLPEFGIESIGSMVSHRISRWQYAGVGSILCLIVTFVLYFIPAADDWLETLKEYMPLLSKLFTDVVQVIPYFITVCFFVIILAVACWKFFYSLDKACMGKIGENDSLKLIVIGEMDKRREKWFWRRWVCKNKMSKENSTFCISNHPLKSSEKENFPVIVFDTDSSTEDGMRYLQALAEYWETRDVWKKLF